MTKLRSSSVLGGLLVLSAAGGLPTRDTPPGRVNLGQCFPDNATVATPWLNTLGDAMEVVYRRSVAGGHALLQVRKTTGFCEYVPWDTTCAGQDEAIICRGRVLARIGVASALRIALTHTVRTKPEQPTELTFRAARAYLEQGSSAAISLLRKSGLTKTEADNALVLVQAMEARARSDREFARPIPIHLGHVQLVLEATLAFLLGHESFHQLGGQCAVSKPARLESQNRFRTLYRLQRTNDMFCARNPETREVQADLCGLRVVRAYRDWLTREIPEPHLVRLVLDLAADQVAWLALTGWEGERATAGAPGYLYPPVRITMITAELAGHPQSLRNGVCGDRARYVAGTTVALIQGCEASKGDVPDEFLAYLPPGLVRHWESGGTKPARFDCAP